MTEVAFGVSAAFTRHWRLQIEVAERRAEGPGSPLADGTLVRVQLGSRFAEAVDKNPTAFDDGSP